MLRKRTLNRSAPHTGSVQWPLIRRVGKFTSHRYIVLQEGPQKMTLPYSPIRLAPAGQKTAWGASRQKSDSRIGREAHPALKDTPQKVQKPPSGKRTQDVATGRRASTATDAFSDTAKTKTDVIRDTARTTEKDATSDTAMPEKAVTPPMMTTPSQTNHRGATTGVVTHAANIGSGEKTPTWTGIVAPAEKETAITGAETAGLPRGRIRNGCR